jgi:hypothetical protein
VREVNPIETLEAILGIHGKSIANIEYAGNEKLPADFKENIYNDMTEEEHDPQVRLSAVVAYCGLGMSILFITSLTNSQRRTVEKKDKITESILDGLDVVALFKDREPAHQGRACAALPALCGIRTLRKKLLKEDLIHRILDLCRTVGENQLIAIKTLSYLAEHFG